MNNRLYKTFYPFFVAGLIVVLAIFAIFLLSILLIKAAIVGFILFALVWLRNLLFPGKSKAARFRKSSTQSYDQTHSEPHQNAGAADNSSKNSKKRAPVTFEHGEY